MKLPGAVIACGLVLAAGPLTAADDFRVETDVLVGEKKEPIAQYLTLFHGGRVYDFMLDEPHETTIYDVRGGRFVLLSPGRQVRTEIDLDHLLRLITDVQFHAAASDDADVRFMANPVFEISFDEAERRVKLGSRRLTYTAQGIAPQPRPGGDPAGIVRRYQGFADNYARLNGIRLGNLPPFARMQLNEQLASRGLVPEVVEKTLVSRAPFGKEVKVRSRHLYTWRLIGSDEEKIARASRDLNSFKHVPLGEYLRWPERVARQK
jgi:hypothetical protein